MPVTNVEGFPAFVDFFCFFTAQLLLSGTFLCVACSERVHGYALGLGRLPRLRPSQERHSPSVRLYWGGGWLEGAAVSVLRGICEDVTVAMWCYFGADLFALCLYRPGVLVTVGCGGVAGRRFIGTHARAHMHAHVSSHTHIHLRTTNDDGANALCRIWNLSRAAMAMDTVATGFANEILRKIAVGPAADALAAATFADGGTNSRLICSLRLLSKLLVFLHLCR